MMRRNSSLAVCMGRGISACALLGLLAGPALAQRVTPVKDVENPALTPFQSSGTVTIDPGFGGVFGTPVASIEEGQRLVVEHVSANCNSPSGNAVTSVSVGITMLTSPSSSVSRTFQIPIRYQGTASFGGPTYVGSLATRLYADRGLGSSGVGVTGGVLRETGTGSSSCFISISGHTVTLP